MNDHERNIVREMAAILDDRYGQRPPLHILELAFGETIGRGLNELIDIARHSPEELSTDTTHVCGNERVADSSVPFESNEYGERWCARCGERILTQQEAANAAIPGHRFNSDGTYTELHPEPMHPVEQVHVEGGHDRYPEPSCPACVDNAKQDLEITAKMHEQYPEWARAFSELHPDLAARWPDLTMFECSVGPAAADFGTATCETHESTWSNYGAQDECDLMTAVEAARDPRAFLIIIK